MQTETLHLIQATGNLHTLMRIIYCDIFSEYLRESFRDELLIRAFSIS